MAVTVDLEVGMMTVTPDEPGALPVVINGACVVTEGGVKSVRKNATTVSTLTPTGYVDVIQYSVILDLTNLRIQQLYMGQVENQPTWTNDETGTDTAVEDIKIIFQTSGGGGGSVNAVTASSPLSSSGGTNPNISHQASGVAAATYTVNGENLFTVNATGHVTNANSIDVVAEAAGLAGNVQYNDGGSPAGLAGSGDFTFNEGTNTLSLGVNADSSGTLNLGAAGTGGGVIEAPGEDGLLLIASNTDGSIAFETNGVERLNIDQDGAFLLETDPGADGQVLTSAGPGAPAVWRGIAAGAEGEIQFRGPDGALAADQNILYEPEAAVDTVAVVVGTETDKSGWILMGGGGTGTGGEVIGNGPDGLTLRTTGSGGPVTIRTGNPTPLDRLTITQDGAIELNGVASTAGQTIVSTGATTPPVWGAPMVLTGNTIWVDAVNGNDSTGLVGRQDRPFLTITAAKNAASSGQLVWVRPGTYDEYDLVKDGLNYYFDLGARVIYTGTPSGANPGVFRTTLGDTVSAFNVSGYGYFEWAAGGVGYVAYWQASNSVVRIICEEVRSNGTDLFGCDSGVDVDIVMRARIGTCTNDAFYSAIVSGTVTMEIDQVTSGTSLIVSEAGDDAVVFNIYTQKVNCNRIGSSTGGTLNFYVNDLDYAFAGNAFSYEGGPCRFFRGRFVATDADGYFATVVANNMQITGCTLINGASAVASIDASAAQTVTSYTSYSNLSADVDVTMEGIFEVGSYVQ